MRLIWLGGGAMPTPSSIYRYMNNTLRRVRTVSFLCGSSETGVLVSVWIDHDHVVRRSPCIQF